MKINNEFVMTLESGKNMESKLIKLAKNKGFTDRRNVIFVGKANFEEKGAYSYVDGTKEGLKIDDFEAFAKFADSEFVGYCGNKDVYLYK